MGLLFLQIACSPDTIEEKYVEGEVPFSAAELV